MDYDSSVHFLSSLAKFLQSLCNGYIQFNNGVQINGHLYLNIDMDKTIDYVVNEKVFKTKEKFVSFTSESFYAQPAERPKKKSRIISTSNHPNSKSKDSTVFIEQDSDVSKIDNRTNDLHRLGIGIFSGNVLSSSNEENQDLSLEKISFQKNLSTLKNCNFHKLASSDLNESNKNKKLSQSCRVDESHSDIQIHDSSETGHIKLENPEEGDDFPVSNYDFVQVKEETPTVELDTDVQYRFNQNFMTDNTAFSTNGNQTNVNHLSVEQMENPHVNKLDCDAISDVHPLLLFANPSASSEKKYGLRRTNAEDQKQGRIKRKYLETEPPFSSHSRLISKSKENVTDEKRVRDSEQQNDSKRKNVSRAVMVARTRQHGDDLESPLMKVVERLKKQKESAGISYSLLNGKNSRSPKINEKIKGKENENAPVRQRKLQPFKSTADQKRERLNKYQRDRYYAKKQKKLEEEKIKREIYDLMKPVKKAEEDTKYEPGNETRKRRVGRFTGMTPDEIRKAKNKIRMGYYYLKRIKEGKPTKGFSDSVQFGLNIEENKKRKETNKVKKEEEVEISNKEYAAGDNLKGKNLKHYGMTSNEIRKSQNKKRMECYYAKRKREGKLIKGFSDKVQFGLSIEEKIVMRNKKRKEMNKAKKAEGVEYSNKRYAERDNLKVKNGMSPDEIRIAKNKKRMEYYYAKRLREGKPIKAFSENVPFGYSIEEKIIMRNKKRKAMNNAKTALGVETSHKQSANEYNLKGENLQDIDVNVLQQSHNLFANKMENQNFPKNEKLNAERTDNVMIARKKCISKKFLSEKDQEEEEKKRLMRNKLRMEKYYAQKEKMLKWKERQRKMKDEETTCKEQTRTLPTIVTSLTPTVHASALECESVNQKEDSVTSNDVTVSPSIDENLLKGETVTPKITTLTSNVQSDIKESTMPQTQSVNVEVNGLVICFNETDKNGSPTP